MNQLLWEGASCVAISSVRCSARVS